MPNPQIDQVIGVLWSKAVPWILFCSFIGTFGGLFVKWLDRKATEFGRRRNARISVKAAPGPFWVQKNEVPHCPKCNAIMVNRTARRGARAGDSF
jgi:hypothetical protein